jgi:lipopolysaccharide biosynthesis regulator YciM
MQILVWLLLPVAAASGWWAARYSHKKSNAGSRAVLNSAYGEGLNYLLNEQPDKATEVLVQMLEVDPDTVELHLALGSLFRRRGEVDRAIRVHENVMGRLSLSQELRQQASLELGRDFLKAGLLDRAEQLFARMLAKGLYEKEVCRHLADLYQQVSEWEKAIEIGGRLANIDSKSWCVRIAHYRCELGELALQQNDLERALNCAGRALDDDPGCVRATLLRGRCHEAQGDFRAAVDAYRQVQEQDASLIAEVIGALERCYAALGETRVGLVGVQSGAGAVCFDDEPAVVARRSGVREARYRCEACGFSSRKLFWQCPGCRDWSTVKPITAGNAQ